MVDYNVNARKFENETDPTALNFTGGLPVVMTGSLTVTGALIAGTVSDLEVVTDPGDGNPIPAPTDGSNFSCAITTEGAETRSMGTPTRLGQKALIVFAVDGGDLVMSNAGGWIDGADNTLTFDTALESVILEAVGTGAVTDWRVTSKKGVALTTV